MEVKIILIAIALLFGWYNGMFNLWGLEKDAKKRKRYSQNWHILGWIIRAGLALVATLLYGLFWGWLMVILLWHCFDIIIALTLVGKWNYIGTVSEFDKRPTLILIGKILFLLAGLLFLI